jgi:hypothetical protein
MADGAAVASRFGLDHHVADYEAQGWATDPLAANDHTDWRWDERILDDLRRLERQMRPVGQQLADAAAHPCGQPGGSRYHRPS